jgi:hypothetical protein
MYKLNAQDALRQCIFIILLQGIMSLLHRMSENLASQPTSRVNRSLVATQSTLRVAYDVDPRN